MPEIIYLPTNFLHFFLPFPFVDFFSAVRTFTKHSVQQTNKSELSNKMGRNGTTRKTNVTELKLGQIYLVLGLFWTKNYTDVTINAYIGLLLCNYMRQDDTLKFINFPLNLCMFNLSNIEIFKEPN